MSVPIADESRSAGATWAAYGSTAVSIAAGLLIWEATARSLGKLVLAPPTAVLTRLGETTASGELPRSLAHSAVHAVAGFALATIVAVPLGLLLGRSERLRLLCEPALNALYAIPTIGFVPILIVWFGLFLPARIALVFAMCFFDMLAIVSAGSADVDRRLLDAGRSLGASRWATLTKILLPASRPFLFVAIRIGAVRAINGMITAELFFAAVNLGAAMKQSAARFDSAGLLAIIAATCLAGLVAQSLLRRLETRFVPLRAGSEHD